MQRSRETRQPVRLLGWAMRGRRRHLLGAELKGSGKRANVDFPPVSTKTKEGGSNVKCMREGMRMLGGRGVVLSTQGSDHKKDL